MTVDTPPRYSAPSAAALAGVTYRRLDYWCRTNLVTPTLESADGSGTRRRYSPRDVLRLRIVASLSNAGVRLEHIRALLATLADSYLPEQIVVIMADQVALIRPTQWAEVLSHLTGPAIILPIASLTKDLDL